MKSTITFYPDAEKTLGSTFLTDIFPAHEYVDGVKTEKVVGYTYVVACTGLHMEKIRVRIDGPKKIELQAGKEVKVTFDDFSVKIYPLYKTRSYEYTYRAKDIRIVGEAALSKR